MSTPVSRARPRSRASLAALAATASAALALALAGGHAAEGHNGHAVSAKKSGPTAKHLALHDDMRRLWEDHITWTRLFIVSASADLPDKQATTQRLLQNQEHIGDAIKPFYGDAAGERLTALLSEHIVVAANLLAAAKAGDPAAVDRESTAWYRNADEIGDFLHSANPRHWEQAEMRAMMREHLDLTLTEAVAHLHGDFAKDIATYDEIHRQILAMADMLSDGIVAQFPKRFR